LKKIGEIEFTETSTDRVTVSREVKSGKMVRIAPGVYTRNVHDPVEAIARRNWQALAAHRFPGSIVSHRSALVSGLVSEREKTSILFLTGTTYKISRFPGFTINVVPGPRRVLGDGRIPEDMKLADNDLYISSRARTFLELLKPSTSGRLGLRKGMSKEDVSEQLGRLYQSAGEKALNNLRDQAKDLETLLNATEEVKKLSILCSELLGTQKDKKTTRSAARYWHKNLAVDESRVRLFEGLLNKLREAPIYSPLGRPDIIDNDSGLGILPFIDAYFSNYIEGTQFEVDEAIGVVSGTVVAKNPPDAKDIIATYRLLSDRRVLSRFPITDEGFIETLKDWHKTLMQGRPEKNPGIFKTIPNRAGMTRFVEPDKVLGTLQKGFEMSNGLEEPTAKAFFLKFVTAEVHPFLDGNGRLSRVVMNAVLLNHNLERVVIPNSFREDYLTAMSALSHNAKTEPFIKALRTAQRWTEQIPNTDLEAARRYISQTNALANPREGRLLIPVKSLDKAGIED